MANDTSVDLTTTGGVVAVILAEQFNLPADYDMHPQVFAVGQHELPIIQEDMDRKLPAQVRLVVIGGEIPHSKFVVLRNVCERRQVPFVQRRNQPALADAIARCFPSKNGDRLTAPMPAPKKVAARGSVRDLVAEADLSKGSAEEARRLMRVAIERGITTTVASLAQGISQAKRKGGRTETPRSLMTAQARALTTLDEAIAGLQLIREYVADTEALNLELHKKLEAFRQMAAKITG